MTSSYNTGIGSRHTVYFPESDFTLSSYSARFSWDDSRNSYMAMVDLWHLERHSGAYSSESFVVYNMPNPELDTDARYRALAEALKMSSNPWKIRKLRFSSKNRKLRGKLEEYGWHS